MDRLIYYLSGEYLLATRPNGGTVVFVRSMQITLILYTPLAFLKYFSEHQLTGDPSLKEFARAIASSVPWFGAIFAAAYATFYSRFAAQWSYLANLYNQIMGASVAASNYDRLHSEELRLWKAAFIEDAQDLHLARKPMFKHLIACILSEDGVRDAYITSCPDGEKRIIKLDQILADHASPKDVAR